MPIMKMPKGLHRDNIKSHAGIFMGLNVTPGYGTIILSK